MTPSEAATLLGHIAAFDRRTVGETDARAWAAALHDLPLDQDTLNAVAQFFGDPQRDPEAQRWIQPHHIRTLRVAIRNERIEAANLLHEPQPDETTSQFLRRRRAQLAAAANGHTQPGPRQALKGGPHPNVAKAIEGAFQAVPTTPVDNPPYVPSMARQVIADALPRWADRYLRWPELAIACPNPTCRALPRRACKRPSGKELREHTHPARRDAWNARTEAPDAS